jgi:hypothetical protein
VAATPAGGPLTPATAQGAVAASGSQSIEEIKVFFVAFESFVLFVFCAPKARRRDVRRIVGCAR